MAVDWDYVKKATLWSYEDLIKKLQDVLAYPFVEQFYNHSMPQAVDFARRLFPTIDWAAGDYPAPLLPTFKRLEATGVSNWAWLLSQITTREQCLVFVEKSALGFEELIDVLNYLLRWALPFRTATRELLAHDDLQEMAAYEALKQYRLRASFDVLERGRTEAGRHALAKLTGLPNDFITMLVHRADIARLPYVRRKTILPLCGAGYNTLAKIAAADLEQMEAAMDVYFQRTQGKRWADFKSVIILRGLVAGAQALPVVVEQ